MGTFAVPMRISSLNFGRTQDVVALVDTGSEYTVAPASLLTDLGITPDRSLRFRLADGRITEMEVGQAIVSINDATLSTLVVFGMDDSTTLLGAYTLEGLQLTVDPVNQRLTPTERLPL